ncbi:MAG: DUF1292 domain-containing protein [Firmicutes bacterium]|jgi:uncharacterized protein YrzB (UPF0473 family)|nr:DUF1292 domain-containing protein [Bacillota bacterium]
MLHDGEELITLVDEEGQEHDFALDCTLEVDGQLYAVLIPLDETEEDDDGPIEAFIFRVEENDGEEQLVMLDDEEEFARVAQAYEEFDGWDEESQDYPGESED